MAFGTHCFREERRSPSQEFWLSLRRASDRLGLGHMSALSQSRWRCNTGPPCLVPSPPAPAREELNTGESTLAGPHRPRVHEGYLTEESMSNLERKDGRKRERERKNE